MIHSEAVDSGVNTPDSLGLALRSVCGGGGRARWCTVRPGRNVRRRDSLAIHLYAVARGSCWVEIGDGGSPVHLLRGDVAVLPGGAEHRLSVRGPVRSRAAAEAVVAWGHVPLGHGHWSQLLEGLAPVIQLGQGEGRLGGWLQETLCLAADQSRRGGPGSRAIVDLLLEGVLVQALRTHLTAQRRQPRRPLQAVMDVAIGPTIGRMHERPGDPWTVASLAMEAGLSRSAYAERFTALAGVSPIQYLYYCRMRAASRLLRQDSACLKEIANRVGYAAEPAFSAAFKRWSGRSPGAYRTLRQDAAR